jgi:hypothetical protein
MCIYGTSLSSSCSCTIQNVLKTHWTLCGNFLVVFHILVFLFMLQPLNAYYLSPLKIHLLIVVFNGSRERKTHCYLSCNIGLSLITGIRQFGHFRFLCKEWQDLHVFFQYFGKECKQESWLGHLRVCC